EQGEGEKDGEAAGARGEGGEGGGCEVGHAAPIGTSRRRRAPPAAAWTDVRPGTSPSGAR
ncbi:MAG TPA: hypothetical protein VN213_02605, partial [Solirubrobacteraceae bacterium]|nr:hypothetical protein [Solirubrobacteraceae bacterium]